MASITTRAGKGSPLTNAEVDANFTNLNTELIGKLSLAGGTMTGAITFAAGQTWPTFNQNTTGSAASLTTGRTIGMTGDVTWTSGAFNGTANVTGTATLSASGVTAGTYGSAVNIPQITVDAKGRLTNVSNVAVSIPSGSLTFTGDVTGTGSTGSSTTLTLANSGVTAGTYTKVTVDAKGRATTGASLSSSDVTTALGYTPYNSSNPNGYTSNTGTVTSVSGTGTVSGLTLSGTVTGSGSITLGGTLSLTSSQVTTALGYTPYNSSNPSGYITSSALSSYLPLSGGTLTGNLVSTSGMTAWNVTTPGTTVGNYHIGTASATGSSGGAITFGARDASSGSNAQAGIYIVSDGSYGTRMYLATTDSYATGARTAVSISEGGNVNIVRGALTQGGNQVLHANNYTSYAIPRSGSWLGDLGSYGYTREHGISMSGGSEFVVLSKNGQGYTLVDGSYFAYEAGGFYSSNNSSGGTLYGFYADSTSSLNFNTTAVKLSGNQILHAGNYSSYAMPLGGGSMSGTLTARSGGSFGAVTSLGWTAPIQIAETNVGSSGGSFVPMISQTSLSNSGYRQHTVFGSYRGQVWGSAFIAVGGNDSYPTVAYYFDYAGNFTAPGNVTAYSDERLKKDWAALPSDFIERLSNIKHGTYTRVDTGERQAGSSAQDWQALLPEVVTTNGSDSTLALAYGNAAVVSAIELAKDNLALRARIERLESLISKLIGA